MLPVSLRWLITAGFQTVSFPGTECSLATILLSNRKDLANSLYLKQQQRRRTTTATVMRLGVKPLGNTVTVNRGARRTHAVLFRFSVSSVDCSLFPRVLQWCCRRPLRRPGAAQLIVLGKTLVLSEFRCFDSFQWSTICNARMSVIWRNRRRGQTLVTHGKSKILNKNKRQQQNRMFILSVYACLFTLRSDSCSIKETD